MSSDLELFCTPIKDQASCGSCTAFGTIGEMEAEHKIKTGETIDLSEQLLFHLSGGTCSTGNTMPGILDAAIKGTSLEDCCPYRGSDGIDNCCKEWWKGGKRIASWRKVSTDEAKEILKTKPIIGAFDVHQSFMSYTGGVYHNLGWIDPVVGGHCITVVDFSDDLKAWKCRNSWGTGWGENGYFWIAYGEGAIEAEMYEAVLGGEPDPVPLPDPGPSPSPCPVGNTAAEILNFFPWLLRRKGRFHYMNPGGKHGC